MSKNIKQTYLTGTANWSKINPPGDQEYEQYSLAFYPNEEALKIILDMNLKTAQRKDKRTGEIFYQLSRKFKRRDGNDYGLVALYTAEGARITDERPQIVNGSKVTVRVTTYPIEKSKQFAIRLDAVRIDEMAVPVERGEDFDLPF